MLFNTQPFAVFFLTVFVGYWLLRRTSTARVLWLLAASYFFYGWWDWRFLGLIVFSTGLDYTIGLKLDRSRHAGDSSAGGSPDSSAGGTAGPPDRGRKRLLILSLVGNLGVLGFFKYWDFFAAELATGLAAFGIEAQPMLLHLILPVGISFYTFQTLSYTLDVYHGHMPAERSLARFALFVAFFPQLVAGPIVRASHFLPQIPKTPRLDGPGFERALALIFWGLVKKVVIADYLGATLVDPFWDQPDDFGGSLSLLAVYGYAFQIYGDFSGYSDIAIGSAALLGFDLGENFHAPYRSCHPREFWGRWHISLSSWLRDYLYISLGGNRGGMSKMYRNLMLTMLLGGLWHGASWMFVAWGLFHGLLLVADRMLGLRIPETATGRWFARAVMFQFTCLGWILFRSADGATAWAVLTSFLAPLGDTDAFSTYVPAVLVLAVLTHMPSMAFKTRLRDAFTALPGLVQGAAYAVLVGLFMQVSGLDVPFIYFQF